MIRAVGRWGIHYCQAVGRSGWLLWYTIFRLPRSTESFYLLCAQIYSEGWLSLVIIAVSGLFIGMVVGLQGYNTLSKFGATQALGQLLAPRFLGGLISLPLLTMVFNVAAIFGGYLVVVRWLGMDSGTFWSNMQSHLSFRADILSGLVKAVVFGFAISWIAVYQGYDCVPTSEGIGKATTRTVVYSSLAILGLNFILTTVMLGGW